MSTPGTNEEMLSSPWANSMPNQPSAARSGFAPNRPPFSRRVLRKSWINQKFRQKQPNRQVTHE